MASHPANPYEGIVISWTRIEFHMNEDLQQAFDQLVNNFSVAEGVHVLQLSVYLVIGGLLAIYLRWLYAYCSSSASDPDSITRVFPILVIVTTGVIAVVKSSLALSLGLVGALSIVRFRAAIKEPEELVYLFLCIGVGLGLGASQPFLAIALVVVSTTFILVMHTGNKSRNQQKVMLTISGDSERYFHQEENNIVDIVQKVAGKCTIHRLDIDNGQGQVRLMLPRTNAKRLTEIVSSVNRQAPGCQVSYVNLDSTW